ncbi:hypothetical protein [Jatrophihabitans lederbergiae]|uniref:Uncharacterized protein n=1 Tax=Jatrophihabitans lederbergiae TaxID=3075547 RepID=A0ABU2JGW2_9ACTN|nr:hypothetical protein [Jatrophihabitans sp. DSM 44399]MDT0264227.1 hypothetical protein [Jatrophihabitans sp. DSM 44399]
MTTSTSDRDRDHTDPPESRTAAAVDGEEQTGKDPRATSHPTGAKQAAVNAENEPAG